MKKILFLFILCLLISTIDSSRRRRQYYGGYNYVQQYANQYGLYGPGGQGWVINNNNRYPNPNFAWNNNYNWNQGNRFPEWYYNSSNTLQPSILCFSIFWIAFAFNLNK